MYMTRATRLLGLLIVGLLNSQTMALAESKMGTSVTCVEPGGISYKRTFDHFLNEEEEVGIERAYPRSMCVFLRPSTVLPTSFVNSGGDDLAAALSIISQGDIGDAYPPGIDQIIKQESYLEVEGAQDLAIGIYKMVAVEDILAHWKHISSTSQALASHVPSIRTRNGLSLLSLKAVPQREIDEICRLLAERGISCITTF